MVDILCNTPFNEQDVKAFFKENDYLFPDPFAGHVDIDQYVDKISYHGFIIAACDETGIVGIVGGYANDTETYCAHLQFILVSAENQGKGYGGHLLKEFINYSKKQKMNTVILTVDNCNRNAKRQYLKVGFIDSKIKHSNPQKLFMSYSIPN